MSATVATERITSLSLKTSIGRIYNAVLLEADDGLSGTCAARLVSRFGQWRVTSLQGLNIFGKSIRQHIHHILSPRDFLAGLAFRVFHCTQLDPYNYKEFQTIISLGTFGTLQTPSTPRRCAKQEHQHEKNYKLGFASA